MDTQYISVAEAARKLGISDRAVRQWIATGKLEAERNGRSWRILASSLGNGSQSEVDFRIISQMQSKIDHLRSELAEKNRQIESLTQSLDHAQQLHGLAQKNIATLTEQIDTQRTVIEDMRRPWWQRVFRRHHS